MNSILKQLRKLSEDELCSVSEAIDGELERRQDLAEAIPESARRRAVMREKSYRHSTGSSALPVRIAGMRKARKTRRAA
jgi:ribosomal protein S13